MKRLRRLMIQMISDLVINCNLEKLVVPIYSPSKINVM